MNGGIWAAFLGASLLLTLMPGPDILFVVAQSVSGSPRDGSAVALGLCTGLLAHISAAALGVSAVVYRSGAAIEAVKFLGAAYLLYLAWQAWRSSSAPAAEAGPDVGEAALAGSGSVRATFGRLYRRGILMNVMNPKVSLFFIAFLPQFVTPGGGPVAMQMAVLGVTFLLQALAVFHVVALAAGKLGRQWIRGAAARRRTARAEAAVYVLLAAYMLLMHAGS